MIESSRCTRHAPRSKCRKNVDGGCGDAGRNRIWRLLLPPRRALRKNAACWMIPSPRTTATTGRTDPSCNRRPRPSRPLTSSSFAELFARLIRFADLLSRRSENAVAAFASWWHWRPTPSSCTPCRNPPRRRRSCRWRRRECPPWTCTATPPGSDRWPSPPRTPRRAPSRRALSRSGTWTSDHACARWLRRRRGEDRRAVPRTTASARHSCRGTRT
mmetsp:Transcript_45801/g.97358  ORF Transcript_45801/g.97358 Transcript_45801/m.97358 type:complete len:216 (+) Transcript_45801:431-1078(+)